LRLERHHRDLNPRLSGLQRSATTCPTGGSERLLNCCNTNRAVCVYFTEQFHGDVCRFTIWQEIAVRL
jgi:hypothetical protein